MSKQNTNNQIKKDSSNKQEVKFFTKKDVQSRQVKDFISSLGVSVKKLAEYDKKK